MTPENLLLIHRLEAPQRWANCLPKSDTKIKKLEVSGKCQVSDEILKRKLITKYAAVVNEERASTLAFSAIASMSAAGDSAFGMKTA